MIICEFVIVMGSFCILSPGNFAYSCYFGNPANLYSRILRALIYRGMKKSKSKTKKSLVVCCSSAELNFLYCIYVCKNYLQDCVSIDLLLIGFVYVVKSGFLSHLYHRYGSEACFKSKASIVSRTMDSDTNTLLGDVFLLVL